ncbi:MAG: glycosyltransferase [Anaerolineae bacterium]|nr:glycosyltransferase [Anaerolineae bacterium]
MISVVVPAYHAAAVIADCLTALQKQTVDRQSYEIIVVDDGSTDDTAVRAQQPGVQLIRCPQNRGAAAARNQGIHAAKGEIVCFTDADCVPQPDWIAEVTRPLRENEGITAVKGVYISHQPQLVARFVQLEYEDKYDGMAGLPQIDFVDTYSCAYRRRILLDSGGFDETIYYVEDQELSFRLAAQRCVMVFRPTAVVAHRHSASLRQYARKKFWIGCWKARFIRRYPDRVIKDSHTPQILKVQMGLAGVVVATAVGGLLFPSLFWLLAAALLFFTLTTLPFCRKAWPKDRAVALAAPFLLFARALALGFGFIFGTLRSGNR